MAIPVSCNSLSSFRLLIHILGVVHAVAYSVLLLNTDLHIADLSTHMSRTQFVRNTLQAIQTQARPPTTRSSTPDLTYDDARSLEGNDMGNTTIKSRSKRSSSVHSWTSVSPEAAAAVSSPPTMSPSGSGSLSTSTASVDTPTSSQAPMYAPYSRSWELMMENTLRVSLKTPHSYRAYLYFIRKYTQL